MEYEANSVCRWRKIIMERVSKNTDMLNGLFEIDKSIKEEMKAGTVITTFVCVMDGFIWGYLCGKEEQHDQD